MNLVLSSTMHKNPLLCLHRSQSHYSLQYTVAYPHEYHFILDELNRCREESPFLVLMIPVAPHNREARHMIRSTWGNVTMVQGKVVSHYFILGQSREENGAETIEEQVSGFSPL